MASKTTETQPKRIEKERETLSTRPHGTFYVYSAERPWTRNERKLLSSTEPGKPSAREHEGRESSVDKPRTPRERHQRRRKDRGYHKSLKLTYDRRRVRESYSEKSR